MIETNAIGHMSTPIEIHLLEKKKFEDSKKYINIYFGKTDISNHFLWNKWKKILKVKFDDKYSKLLLKTVFLYAIKKKDYSMLIPFRHHADFIKDKNSDIYEWQQNDIYDLREKNEPIIQLDDNEVSEGYKILEKLNIQKKDKVVLLCVRDSAFSHRFKKKDDNIKITIRDNEINDFKDLVSYLCEKNYKVIRIGKVVEKKLNFQHENFIDLPFTNVRTDFLDVFLFYISKFIISTGTGIENIGDLFRKKRIWLNFADFEVYNSKVSTSFIHPKEVFDIENNCLLSLIEIFDNNLHRLGNVYEYEQNKFKFKSISSDKMIKSVKEMENFIDQGHSKESYKKNKLMNDLLSKKYDTKNFYNWSEEYLNLQKNLN
tara:strand:+ start:4560 stop:5678 length:1119 start_codon:yes stop_codon:yes gene_type:complete